MIVNEIGRYRLTEDWSSRGSISIAQMEAGTIIEITQVDKAGRKVIGPALQDWTTWDMPVVKIDNLDID